MSVSSKDAVALVKGNINPVELEMQGKLHIAGEAAVGEIFCWFLVGRLQWYKSSPDWWSKKWPIALKAIFQLDAVSSNCREKASNPTACLRSANSAAIVPEEGPKCKKQEREHVNLANKYFYLKNTCESVN